MEQKCFFFFCIAYGGVREGEGKPENLVRPGDLISGITTPDTQRDSE